MLLRTARPTGRPGAAAVEFALLSPLIVALLLGVWEVGRLIQVNQILSNAAREGGRQAATGQNSAAQVQTVVTNYLNNAGVPSGHAVVSVTDLTTGGDPTAATQGDQLQVTVTIPFNDVRWVALSLIASPATTLTGKATWTCLKDQPYPSAPGVPQGW